MRANSQKTKLGTQELVALMALLMSFVALSIDAMLPALDAIQAHFAFPDPNDKQFVVSMIFAGMSAGLIFYGPLSDAFGRKPIFCLGISIFVVGTLIALFAHSYTVFLSGRFIQGLGAASSRVITTAMIRDQFSGKEMARIMSFIVIIFILVPAIAPLIGQGVLFVAGWKWIFGLFLLLAFTAGAWLVIRQPETHPVEARVLLRFSTLRRAFGETVGNKVSRGYTLASGFIFGAMVGFLSSSQQILQVKFALGDLFAFGFAGLALSVGVASYLNSRLVMRFEVERICQITLAGMGGAGLLFILLSEIAELSLGFGGTYVYLMTNLFCIGLLFPNFNTLAITPLGHIAGLAGSVISTVQNFMAVAIGTLIGQAYDGTLFPLALGFTVCSLMSLVITSVTVRYGSLSA